DAAATLVTDRLDRALGAQVRGAIGTVSTALGDAVDTVLLTLDYSAYTGDTISAVAADVLSRAATTPDLQAEATATRQRLDPARATVSDALALTAPLSANPVLADDLRRGQAATYARLAGLDDVTTRAVVSAAPAVLDTGSGVDGLVTGGAIRSAAATKLQAVLDLATLTGGNVGLVAALQAEGTTAPQELAAWTTAQWQTVLRAPDVALP